MYTSIVMGLNVHVLCSFIGLHTCRIGSVSFLGLDKRPGIDGLPMYLSIGAPSTILYTGLLNSTRGYDLKGI